MPPQAGCCGEGNMEIQHQHCHALGTWRSEGKGNCKSDLVANS